MAIASVSQAGLKGYPCPPVRGDRSTEDSSRGRDGPLFDRVVSDNQLIQGRELSESVAKIMAANAKNLSDAVLALPRVRRMLAEAAEREEEEARARSGVKRPLKLDELAKDKFYDGRIVKRTRIGILVDINATFPGLLRWRVLRGVPRQLLKIGGCLVTQVVKADTKPRRLSLKVQSVGFGDDTIEEKDLEELQSRVADWSTRDLTKPAPAAGAAAVGQPKKVVDKLGRMGERRAVAGQVLQAAQRSNVRKIGRMGPRHKAAVADL